MGTMGSGALAGWTDFFVADAGASAALAGLLFVAVSINLGRILEFSHLPLRAGEALVALLSVLFVATVGLVPGQSDHAYGFEVAAIGLATWLFQTFALVKSHRAPDRAPQPSADLLRNVLRI